MPQGNVVEVLSPEARQGSPGQLMVERFLSHQRRPPCKTNKGMSAEAADAATCTYLLTGATLPSCGERQIGRNLSRPTSKAEMGFPRLRT